MQTYTPAPRPFDPVYESQVSGANQQYGNTMAQLQYQEGRYKQDYGFDDSSNPFNKKAMLERSYQQGQRANRMGHSAQGNLYSSALQSDQAEGTHRYNQGYDALSREYADALQGITAGRAQAQTDRDQAIAGYGADALSRVPAAQDPGPYGGIDFDALARLIAWENSQKKQQPKKPAAKKNDPFRWGNRPGGWPP